MKRAYHQIILSDGTVIPMAVAHFDSHGQFTGCHPLQGEEPFVEWVGGTLNLKH